ncbi:butyrophilin subfamily 1 member A1-like [Alosa alosa]|uniref:butyrophilin subfamily 1 member A1-like n=1 Tax=Alosa alosa TaxID=278164 RepID=UPI00201512F2|nr:butyrophilin subfamily 1 member A1-like [Alosa alosa]
MQTLIVLCLIQASLQLFSSDANNTFDAALHDNVILFWNISFKLDPKSDLVVHIQKSEDSSVDIVRLDQKGLKIFPTFVGRVQLLQNSFPNKVVALKMDNVSIQDTGEYKCYASMPLYINQGQCHLKVRAPWNPVQKSNVSMGSGVYTLRCEAKGYPLGTHTWTDGHGKKLTDQAKFTTSITSEQLIHIYSQLNVTISTRSNYTCTFSDDRGVSQSATFVFPDKDKSRHHYWLIPAIGGLVVVLVVLNLKHQCLHTSSLQQQEPRKPSRGGHGGVKWVGECSESVNNKLDSVPPPRSPYKLITEWSTDF